MNKKELERELASLESQLDYMQTEFSYVNSLLIRLGFEEGMVSMKLAAEELVSAESMF